MVRRSNRRVHLLGRAHRRLLPHRSARSHHRALVLVRPSPRTAKDPLTLFRRYGLIDDESLAKIRSAEGRPLTYELRIKDVMRPLMVEHGIDRKPDLMVVTSLFWDEGAIEEVSYAPTITISIIGPPTKLTL